MKLLSLLGLNEDLQELFPSLFPFKKDPRINLAADIVANVSHLLIVTNSAINIVVYALKVDKSEE